MTIAAIVLAALMANWSLAVLIKEIPYLYLSANDGDVAYVDMANYFALDYMIDPFLKTEDNVNVQVLQPFSGKNISYTPFKSKINPKSFSNCTASSFSVTQYSAMVCANNYLYLMAIDELIAVDQLKATDTSCSPGGDLSCHNILFDSAFTAGFVMCVKANDSSTSIVGYSIQYLNTSKPLSRTAVCFTVADLPKNESGATNLRSDIVDVEYLEESTLQVLLANITIVVHPYSDDPKMNDFGSILKFRVTLQLSKQGLTFVSASLGTRTLADLVPPGSVVQNVYGTTSTRFSDLYKSNTLLITTSPNSKSDTPIFDAYFINTTTFDDSGFQIIKKVSLNYDLPTLLSADHTYLMAATLNQTSDDLCTAKVSIVDIYSVFSESSDPLSALIHEYVEFNLTTGAKVNESAQQKLSEVKRNPAKFAVLQANEFMGSLLFKFESGEEILSIIDLDGIVVKRINATGLNLNRVSLSANADQPLGVYNYFDIGSNMFLLSMFSSARSLIGIKKLDRLTFSYLCVLSDNSYNSEANSLKSDHFYLNGTFIKDMTSFVDINKEILNQRASYYANLTYNIYLPWDSIRGADINLLDMPPRPDMPSITAYKYYDSFIVLDVKVKVPDAYFIYDNYLVIVDPDFKTKAFTIMIYKFSSETSGINRYNSVNNVTLNYTNRLKSLDAVTLKMVRVYYDNIICLVLIQGRIGGFPPNKNYLMLVSFFGPNYLRSLLTFELDSPEFYATIQPNNQTSAYYVVSSSEKASYNSYFLRVWNIKPEDLEQSWQLAVFDRSSNVQPDFCPVGLNQDLVDNKFIIIKSYCGKGYQAYSMQLDIDNLLITEFQKDRLIDKTGDVCPSKYSFVKIINGKIKGYRSCPGKAIVNEMEYYSSDLDLTKPYDMTCFINTNLMVIGQKQTSVKGQLYAIYIFHTDRSLEADKRLDQRIRIDANIGRVNVLINNGQLYIHYTDLNTGIMGRITVMLSKTKVYSTFISTKEKIWPMFAEIDLNFVTQSNISKNQTMTVRYDKPKYSPIVTKNTSTLISPNSINNTVLDSLVTIQGPVFFPNIVPVDNVTIIAPLTHTSIWLQDLVIDGRAIIRAPIFNNFDIFLASGSSVIGVVNYPYGFDICVFDNQYLQDPVVTPFLGAVAIDAKAIYLNDSYYLFVKARAIGDTTINLKLYKATTDDLLFSPCGRPR